METIKLEGKKYTLWLEGQHSYGESWSKADCYSDYKYQHKRWGGAGRITVKSDQKVQPFLFTTDTWGDRERNWDRSLKDAVVAFTDADGYEISPDIIDYEAVVDSIVEKILSQLQQHKKDTPIPNVRIRTEKVEPLIEKGVLLGSSGQRHLGLTV